MRYLPLTDGDRAAMLARIGVAGIDDFFKHANPQRRDAEVHEMEITPSQGAVGHHV